MFPSQIMIIFVKVPLGKHVLQFPILGSVSVSGVGFFGF